MADEPRNYKGRPFHVVPGPLQSFAAKNTTGGGTAFRLPHAFREFTVSAFRATTSATKGSTAAVIRLQGSVADSSKWATLGTATLTVNSTGLTLFRSTNAAAVDRVRVLVVSFTTRLASTSPDKANLTAWITVPPGA